MFNFIWGKKDKNICRSNCLGIYIEGSWDLPTTVLVFFATTKTGDVYKSNGYKIPYQLVSVETKETKREKNTMLYTLRFNNALSQLFITN